MPALSEAERDAFLAERGVLMRIATVSADGAPHVTPIWFAHEEGRIWFTPRRASAWREHLLRDPRVALSIDEQPLPYRKVVVEGRAELAFDLGEDARWRDRYLRIASRYVPDAEARAYVEATLDQTRALFAVELARAIVRSWRMPVGDEPYAGIWHYRYYAPGTKLAAG
ncbi:MAG TPA: pyridoxamine 5'-phosphate oxidase family protein [Myxococcota bacterium]|jgi:PPOX class probable F420-dependent enzyme|nr:pyridoxamine 5'-phosphate oxidase family protein [Myxococcota bacterium]